MKRHCLVHHRAENEKRKVNETKLFRLKITRRTQIAIAPVFAIIVALVAFLMVARSSPAQFKGLDLGKTPAPDFRLTDQNGRMVALSDLRGKIVVLTFVYTQCADVCPVIAAKLSQVYDQVGDENRLFFAILIFTCLVVRTRYEFTACPTPTRLSFATPGNQCPPRLTFHSQRPSEFRAHLLADPVLILVALWQHTCLNRDTD